MTTERPTTLIDLGRAVPRLVRTLAAVLALTAGAAAQGQGLNAPALYVRHCGACHGELGDGRTHAKAALARPPRDFTTEEARQVLTRAYMIAIVRDGRPGSPMHGRKTRLSQPQIEAVVDYIRAAYMRAEPGTLRARGREVYTTRCAACHGPRGQGAGLPGRRGQRVAALRTGGDSGAPLRENLRGAIADAGHRTHAGVAQLDDDDVRAAADYVAGALIEPLRP